MIRRGLEWFETQHWKPFGFQKECWRAYLRGESGLVHAPTGRGKSLAAWLGPVLETPEPETGSTIVLWVTPLRALAGDLARNLERPLADLAPKWTLEVRTGDTSSYARARQRRRPPTALITTPESLALLLTYPDWRERFSALRCVVVDEWHELIGSKRGVQTELSLARLRTALPGLRTWGLSATLGNLEEAMQTLLGEHGPRGRLIRDRHRRRVELQTIVPRKIERFPWSGHLGLSLLGDVLLAIGAARGTLLFTNTRSQAERWFQAIVEACPEWRDEVALHHGSIDRVARQNAERGLADGRLRCVVCTSSLDLGIDFAPVERVIQIGSPKGVARLLQRAGRSGHQPGGISRLLCVPTHALELAEYAAARDALRAGEIESRHAVRAPLDVLVQHLVGVAAGGGFEEEALHREVRSTRSFHDLDGDDWQWALTFAGQGGDALKAYERYARMRREGGSWHIRSEAVARNHRMNVGTIVGESQVDVRYLSGTRLGVIEETFVTRLRPKDRFVFAGRTLELVRMKDMTAWVRSSRRSGGGAVPRWQGGQMPLSTQLADRLRRLLESARSGEFRSPEMRAIRGLFALQSSWSAIPAHDELLVERTKVRGATHLFVFAFEGRRVNEGLATLAAMRLTRRRPCTITTTANDYGFALRSRTPLDPDEATWRELLSPRELAADLEECVNVGELARRQFRAIARVAGLVVQGFPGQRRPQKHLQASSGLIFDVLQRYDPGNRLLDQARREVFDRQLERSRLGAALERAAKSKIVLTRPEQLSPLAFPLWAEGLREQQLSSESWTERVRRMVVHLEERASRMRACS